ncbi:SDR family NAD(P)-dependent oxidoreductase [Limnobacter sp.]|uniref:SDR family NAD(P)-dependent oxidoreductase n=1 Tax=Limnobacter sp. TaxID=2003368 RepID=UPI0035170E0B
MNNLNGKTAVVTGAASGIGLALAKHAAAQGMNVVMADIDETALSNAAADLNVPADRLLTVPTDVRHASAIKHLADASYAKFGAVHLLFNNAGVALARTTWEHTADDWQWVLQVNLMSVVHGISEFLPRMQAQGGAAHVVNTASVAGFVSYPGMAAYNVSKHGVVTLSETLHTELQLTQSPVQVHLLCPAWGPTGIGNAQRNRPADVAQTVLPTEGLSAQLNKRIGKAIASGQLTADDMATATFDALRENRFYIIPHRNINTAIEERAQNILQQRNPEMPR